MKNPRPKAKTFAQKRATPKQMPAHDTFTNSNRAAQPAKPKKK